MLEPLRAEFHVSMALISLGGDSVREGRRKEGRMEGWMDG